MKNFLKNLKNKAMVLSATISAAIMGSAVVGVMAGGTTPDTDFKAPVWTAVEKIMDPILWFIALAGVLMVGWGIVQLIMGFKEEDSEKKNRGTWQLIIGLLLAMLRLFLLPILKGLLGI